MKFIDLEKLFNKFKTQLFMNETIKQIEFAKGYGKCLNDVLQYIKRKTRSHNDNLSAVDLLAEFVQPKIAENDNRLTAIANHEINIDDVKNIL